LVKLPPITIRLPTVAALHTSPSSTWGVIADGVELGRASAVGGAGVDGWCA
jgi:hypothetical protein